MILILGGTTEGRVAVQTLEEAGKPFYYSTKGDRQEVTLHHGIRLTGGMNVEEMTRFCQTRDIRLLLDAAHPFAELLHKTVQQTSEALHIPVIRYERIYPDLSGIPITWCQDYEEAIATLKTSDISVLLAMTGVQTIGKLKPIWTSGLRCWFRILDRDSSREIAERQGFPSDRLCYFHAEENDRDLMQRLHPDAILMKESGLSGGFLQKAEAAQALGIRIFVVRRPPLPDSFITVNGPHGLRREIERLLPDFYPLHSGLTTGTCATAAAVAAVYSLLGKKGMSEVPVCLPDGETIKIPICTTGKGKATVVKDAGDDPDITNGTAICANIMFTEATDYQILIKGGKGVGTVTLPGLGLPVGGPAINVTPRQMIENNVLNLLRTEKARLGTYIVTISVPDGKRLAERTFNPRLGVKDGISIIGTSGIVKPFSIEAFVQSIRKSMEVAKATDSPFIIINSGAKSERFLHARYPDLPLQAFVHYGNFIGETLEIATELRIPHLIMGLMIGKAVKLAEGHLNTHSKHTVMNKEFLCRIAAEAGCSLATQTAISRITLARELWQLLPSDELPAFIRHIIRLCRTYCTPLFPDGELIILLISEEGKVYG